MDDCDTDWTLQDSSRAGKKIQTGSIVCVLNLRFSLLSI